MGKSTRNRKVLPCLLQFSDQLIQILSGEKAHPVQARLNFDMHLCRFSGLLCKHGKLI